MKNIVNILPNGSSEILLYGTIGSMQGDEYISASDFSMAFKELESKGQPIRVRINSVGGNVYEGMAILNLIANSKVYTESYVDGIAASMASAIAVSTNKTYMSRFAQFMTHGASMSVIDANVLELTKEVERLGKINELLAKVYSEKTRKPIEYVNSELLGKGDRYFTADEALAVGLVDEIYDGVQVSLPGGAKTSEIYALYREGISAKKGIHPATADNNKVYVFLSDDDLNDTNREKYSAPTPGVKAGTGLNEYEKILLESGSWDKSCKGNTGYVLRLSHPQIYLFFAKEKFGNYPAEIAIRPDNAKQAMYQKYVDEVVLLKIDGMSYDELWRKNPKMLQYIRDRFPEKYNVLYYRKWGRMPR